MELNINSEPGQIVQWKTIDGREHEGKLKEWDNYTAIIILSNGSEVAIRGH